MSFSHVTSRECGAARAALESFLHYVLSFAAFRPSYVTVEILFLSVTCVPHDGHVPLAVRFLRLEVLGIGFSIAEARSRSFDSSMMGSRVLRVSMSEAGLDLDSPGCLLSIKCRIQLDVGFLPEVEVECKENREMRKIDYLFERRIRPSLRSGNP